MKNEKRKAEREERGESEELTVRYASERRSAGVDNNRNSDKKRSAGGRSVDDRRHSDKKRSGGGKSDDKPRRSGSVDDHRHTTRGSSSNTSRPGASGNSTGRRQSSPRSGRSPRNDR